MLSRKADYIMTNDERTEAVYFINPDYNVLAISTPGHHVYILNDAELGEWLEDNIKNGFEITR